MTVVVKLEQKISNSIRKWLYLHNSTTNIFLYFKSSQCPLPTNGLTCIIKSAKICGKLVLPESSDPFVSLTSVLVNTGNWVALNAIAKTSL